ncbi:uncharacterized protein BDZ99DRAFT_511680 [Mytilinidion resinicola]|uniref:ABC transporter domain-containing protein n=1 Tax=Mytilinidion resinicola TaxID=574789 RepID=A0A6A6Y8X4_9PEZI|nr:uncharacterized protein BDZ99DRAFT_511680 [Mytilinidion resinicola]KAF2804277.1 hypothetical protein BDZ99DRAFT_511680 [Mytilinidion resinicola]
MAFLRQTWTLTYKNLLIVFVRHWFATTLRAFFLPILFMFFISYAKNFFVPPSDFGIGTPVPIRSLDNALAAAQGGRDTVVFINNGHTGGQIEDVISSVSSLVTRAGKKVRVAETDEELFTICPSSLRGVSTCYGAASFHASPTEGGDGMWNYTLRADGNLGERIFVNRHDNDAELYILPFQHAIDTAIASLNQTELPQAIDEYPFTLLTAHERDVEVRHLYMAALIDILAVAFFIGICGVTYQLTGQMASERELGISQLIEAMTPASKGWHTQAARLLSNHLAFDIIYLPGWIIMSIIMQRLAFPTTSVAIPIFYHILAGLSLSSFSIFGASFFHKAQLSGITITIASIVLAIIAQVAGPYSTGAVAVMSLLFPPMNYTFFIIYMAHFEKVSRATNLVKGAPNSPWHLPGIALWVFLIIQIMLYPVLGAFVERWLYGTASKDRKMAISSPDNQNAIELTNFSKHFQPSWFRRLVLSRIGIKTKNTVYAVNDVSWSARRGQIMVLLGANGSGKSTTLDAISGLNSITSGSIELDGTGGLGLCPQKNVLWDELTVFEHVKIFNRLKSMDAADGKFQVEDLVKACDLGHKLKAKSETLSGGQKRKLQLAMMFTGGSRVCCVDEVSSGLDPLSRRKIWDILLAERGLRTLLLTTHFLDEADILSDHIVVLSKGHLKAEGSAVELKHHHGGGYRVTLPANLEYTATEEFEDIPIQTSYDQTTFLPKDSAETSRLVNTFERQGIQGYDISGPTLENVFLNLAEEVREDEPDTPTILRSDPSRKDLDGVPILDGSSQDEKGPQMSTGKGTTMPQQTWILFMKRIAILRRNYLPYVVAVLIPIITAGLVTLFISNFSAVGCEPGAQSTTPRVFSLNTKHGTAFIPLGPPSLVPIDEIVKRSGQNASAFHLLDTVEDFQDFIATHYHNVTPGGFFLSDAVGENPLIAYLGNSDIVDAMVAQNALSSVLTQISINTAYQSFAVPFAPGAGQTLQLILYFGLAMAAYPGFFALYPTVERLRKVRALHYSNGIRAAPLWMAYLAFDFMFVLFISAIVTGIFVGASSAWYAPGYLFVVFFLYGLASILIAYVVSLFVTSQLAAFAFAAGGQAVFYLIYFIMYMCILTYSPANRINHELTLSHFILATITPAGNLLRSMLLALNEFSLLCRGQEVASYPGAITVYGGPILYLILQSLVLLTFLIWYDSGYKPALLTLLSRHRLPHPEETHPLPPDVAFETTATERSTPAGLRVLHLSKSFAGVPAVADLSFSIPHGAVFALLGPNGAGKSTTISLIRGDLRPAHHGGGDVLIEDTSIISHRAAARAKLGVCPQFDAMDAMTTAEHLRFYARVRGVGDVARNVEAVMAAVGLTPFAARIASALSGGNKRKLSLAIALMGNPSVLLLDEPSSGMDAAAKRVMWKTLLGVAAPGRALLITTHSMEEADRLATRVGIMKGRMLAVGSAGALRGRWGGEWGVHLCLGSAPGTTREEMDKVRRWIRENVRGAVVEDEDVEEGRQKRVGREEWGGHGQLRFRVVQAAYTHPPPSTLRDEGEKETDSEIAESVDEVDEDARSGNGPPPGIASLFALLEANKEELGFEYYSISPTTLDQVFLRIVGKEEQDEGKQELRAGKKGRGWRVWRR